MSGPRDETGESDVESDPDVAGSRAGKSDDDEGTYVGRTGSDDAGDVGESGAEARSKQANG